MIYNPFARLMMLFVSLLILFILIEEWITIELRGFINRRRNKKRKGKAE